MTRHVTAALGKGLERPACQRPAWGPQPAVRVTPGGPGDGGRAGRGAGMRGEATDSGTPQDTGRLDSPEPQQTREAALRVGVDEAGRTGAQPPRPLFRAPTFCRPTTRSPPPPYPGPGRSQDWCRLPTSSSSACRPRRLPATVSAAVALGLPVDAGPSPCLLMEALRQLYWQAWCSTFS